MRHFSRTLVFGLLTALLLFLPLWPASAQYVVNNLDANTSSLGAAHVDPNLVDGWGISFFPTSPFWISDQNTSVATLYAADGSIVPLVVQIPCIVSGSATAPCPKVHVCAFPNPCLSSLPPFFGPSGTVANTFTANGAFSVTQGSSSAPALFLFTTLDGLVVGWNPGVAPVQAVVGADQSGSGAIYFGLALAGPPSDPHLYAANGASGGMIDVFDKDFNHVASFAADHHPGPFTPYGIRVIGDQLYVTYATAPPILGGILDVCDLSTSPVTPKCHRRFFSPPTAHHWVLNSPWGIALAPDNFGPLSNKLLVGNVNDGLIHAFEIGQGHTEDENGSDSDQQSVRTLNVNGNPFAVPGLWGLAFGSGAGGSNGAANQLFFAAGPGPTPTEIFSQGLFGVITPDSTAKK